MNNILKFGLKFISNDGSYFCKNYYDNFNGSDTMTLDQVKIFLRQTEKELPNFKFIIEPMP
jgi:hypothetical protein